MPAMNYEKVSGGRVEVRGHVRDELFETEPESSRNPGAFSELHN